MRITNYESDEISMRCIALQLVEEFHSIKRIGDTKVVWTWDYHVSQQRIVADLWKYLDDALASCNDKYGVCKAEIVYETHRSMDIRYHIDEDDIDACTTTGIKLTRVTDAVANEIIKENKRNLPKT